MPNRNIKLRKPTSPSDPQHENTICETIDKGFFAGRRVLVMGLGRFGGGVDTARFACNAGAKVVITDLLSADELWESIRHLEDYPEIEYHLGSHNAIDFEQADVIIANPAVAPDNEFLKFARQRSKFATSQMNIFFELCHAPIIAITGANGKSTTAALTAHLLRATTGKCTKHAIRNTQYEKVWLSGNIGNEPMLSVVDQIKANDLVVLEVSSFQAQALAQISKGPKVAVLTNLTPNHLDRHGTFENYCAAKENIFKLQKLDDNCPAVSVFNAEDKVGAEWFEKYNHDKGRVCISYSVDDISEEIRDGFSLPGRANLSNLAAAVTVARYFGVEDEQIRSCLSEFKPLPHRLEFVAEIDGVRWFNDSIATTPESAIAALEAFEQPKIIIAGGYDKNLPFDELGKKIAESTKAAILIGQTAEKIAASIRHTQIETVATLADAVHLAAELAAPGDVVLLSPACASYDMFDNFQHRGREFINLVREVCN